MSEYEEQFIKGLAYTKRVGIVWTPWMGDWFTSYSPRNSNSNAEGPWEHWVEMALSVLKHPATKLVRPEVYDAVKDILVNRRYDDADRYLTDDELETLFRSEG